MARTENYEANPETGKRTRRKITFDESITSERAAKAALQPYLDDYNAKAQANAKPPAPPKSGKTVGELIKEWQSKILPNRKPSGARAALSHIRTYIIPLVGEIPLRDLHLSQHQQFVTAVGQRVDRRKTAENVYGTLTSILNLGRRWVTPSRPLKNGTSFSPQTNARRRKFSFLTLIPRRES